MVVEHSGRLGERSIPIFSYVLTPCLGAAGGAGRPSEEQRNERLDLLVGCEPTTVDFLVA